MKMKKRLSHQVAAIAGTLLMMGVLCACGSSENQATVSETASTETAATESSGEEGAAGTNSIIKEKIQSLGFQVIS